MHFLYSPRTRVITGPSHRYHGSFKRQEQNSAIRVNKQANLNLTVNDTGARVRRGAPALISLSRSRALSSRPRRRRRRPTAVRTPRARCSPFALLSISRRERARNPSPTSTTALSLSLPPVCHLRARAEARGS